MIHVNLFSYCLSNLLKFSFYLWYLGWVFDPNNIQFLAVFSSLCLYISNPFRLECRASTSLASGNLLPWASLHHHRWLMYVEYVGIWVMYIVTFNAPTRLYTKSISASRKGEKDIVSVSWWRLFCWSDFVLWFHQQHLQVPLCSRHLLWPAPGVWCMFERLHAFIVAMFWVNLPGQIETHVGNITKGDLLQSCLLKIQSYPQLVSLSKPSTLPITTSISLLHPRLVVKVGQAQKIGPGWPFCRTFPINLDELDDIRTNLPRMSRNICNYSLCTVLAIGAQCSLDLEQMNSNAAWCLDFLLYIECQQCSNLIEEHTSMEKLGDLIYRV